MNRKLVFGVGAAVACLFVIGAWLWLRNPPAQTHKEFVESEAFVGAPDAHDHDRHLANNSEQPASQPVCTHASAIEALKQASAISDIRAQRAAMQNVIDCGPRTLKDCHLLASTLRAVTDHVTNHVELMVLSNPATSAAFTLGECYIDLMRDANPALQMVGAIGAGRMRDLDAKDELLRLLKSNHSELAVAASQALGELGDDSIVSDLLNASAETDGAALLAIPKLGVTAVRAAINALKLGVVPAGWSDDVLWIVATLGGPEYRDIHRELANSDEVDFRVAGIAGMVANKDPLAVEKVKVALSDSDRIVRFQVVQFVDEIKTLESAKLLLDVLREDADEGVRAASVSSLSSLYDVLVLEQRDSDAQHFFEQVFVELERIRDSDESVRVRRNISSFFSNIEIQEQIKKYHRKNPK